MTVTSCPAPRAASRTRKGKRPLPAIRPRRTLFVRDDFFCAAGRASENDAALRRADEVDQVLHFRARQRAVLLDLFESASGVQLRLQQVAERPFDLRDHIL